MYLGDGLYAEDEGFRIKLWTERENNTIHEIYLEDNVLQNFFKFIENSRNLHIKIEKVEIAKNI